MADIVWEGLDPHDIIDLLVQVVEWTKANGRIPSVQYGGRLHSPLSLAQLVPGKSKALSDKHRQAIEGIFQKRQTTYAQTAANLAHRASQIHSANIMRQHYQARPSNG